MNAEQEQDEYEEEALRILREYKEIRMNEGALDDLLCLVSDSDLLVIEYLLRFGQLGVVNYPAAEVTSTPGILPMESAPKDGTYVLLFGDSGYASTNHRCEVCRYDLKYRPLAPWQTYSDDAFTDSGGEPIGWLPLPGKCTRAV